VTGPGAAVVEASPEDGIGIIDFENYVDGSGGDALKMPAGRQPASGRRTTRSTIACTT
jgi:3-oxoacyl-[acyl-carrier-protein] synthase III